MTLFRNVVFVAAISGLLAGIVLALLQTFATVPLILEAETFESASAPVHELGAPADTASVEAVPLQHGEGAWAPADGFQRFAFSAAVNIVSGIGFALLLVTASELAGGMAGWRQGTIWGFAGFAVFTLAPNLGLPPELPAMPAADLFDRQAWWLGTVAATAGGLALIAFPGRAALALIGLVLIVSPHLIGAPRPASTESVIPVDLHQRFVVAVTVSSLVFWVLLGAVAGVVRQRLLGASGGFSRSLA